MKNTGRKFMFFNPLKTILMSGIFLLSIQTNATTQPVINVGIYQNPPKIFINENGEPDGIFIELLNEIARQEGWKINFVENSWNNCLEKLQSGEIDLMPDVALTQQRTKIFDFNQIPALENWSQVYALPGSKINRFSDLEGKHLAVLEGSVQQERLRQLMNGFGYGYKELLVNSFSDAFAEVTIGVADAAAVNNYYGEMHCKNSRLVRTPVIFDPTALYFAVPKSKNKYLLQTIDNYLTIWKETPQSFYYKTLNNFNGLRMMQQETHSHINFYVIFVLLAAALLIIYFVLQKQTRKLKKNKKLLKQEEEKFRSYIESAPYGVFVVNKNAEYIDVNLAACQLTGYSREELLSKRIIDLVPAEAHISALKHIIFFEKEGRDSDTFPYFTKSGIKKYWKIDAAKISSNRFIGFAKDVTYERDVEHRHELLSEIFDQSQNEIYLFDSTTFKFLEANKKALANTGYTLDEMQQMTPLDLKLNLAKGEFYKIAESLKHEKNKQIIIETQHFRKDGTFYEAEIYLQILESGKMQIFLAIILDVSSRKNAERELTEIKRRLEIQIAEKTKELSERIVELESFREATLERELRMEELRQEIQELKRNRQ